MAGFPVAMTSVGATVTGSWAGVMPILKEIHETLGGRKATVQAREVEYRQGEQGIVLTKRIKEGRR